MIRLWWKSFSEENTQRKLDFKRFFLFFFKSQQNLELQWPEGNVLSGFGKFFGVETNRGPGPIDAGTSEIFDARPDGFKIRIRADKNIKQN
jgi:hypothetical protein